MIKIISLFLMCFFSTMIWTQEAAYVSGDNTNAYFSSLSLSDLNEHINKGTYSSALKSYEEIKGTPFINDEGTTGTLIMNDGAQLSDIEIKVDMYASLVSVVKNDENIVLDPDYYWEIIIQHKGRTISLKKTNPIQPDKYCEVLYDNEGFYFFKDYRVSLKEGKDLGITKQPSIFNHRAIYYVSDMNGDVTKVNLKKDDVLSYFPASDKTALKDLARKKKIKLTKENQYIELFDEFRKANTQE